MIRRATRADAAAPALSFHSSLTEGVTVIDFPLAGDAFSAVADAA